MVNHVIGKGMKASISIQIGEGFHFKFENYEANEKNVKKKSPSREISVRERFKKTIKSRQKPLKQRRSH